MIKISVIVWIICQAAVGTQVLSPNIRIFGGHPAVTGSIPFQASIRNVANDLIFGYGHFCGGSLINNHTVLTAAHCLVDEKNLKFNASSIRVVGGNANRFWNNGTTYVGNVSRTVVHAKYDSKTYANDIGLIILSQPVPENHPTFRPINMSTNATVTNSSCHVSGWGTTSIYDKQSPAVLQVAEVLLYDYRRCERAYGGLPARTVCAGVYAGGVDSCYGDSGGPLTCGTDLVGIVSFGSECGAREFPGIYTEVRQFRKWIAENESSHSANSVLLLLMAAILTLFISQGHL